MHHRLLIRSLAVVAFFTIAVVMFLGGRRGNGPGDSPGASSVEKTRANSLPGANRGQVQAPAATPSTPRRPAGLSPVLADPASAVGRFQLWTQRHLASAPDERAALEAEGVELAIARRAEFKALIAADPREALRQAVPMVVRQQLPAAIVEQLEERVSGNAVLRAYAAGPESVAKGVAPVLRYAEFEHGPTYRAYVYGRREESIAWVPGASLNGVAVDGWFAVNERPLRPLELGEIPPADKRAVEVCPVSGNAAVVAPTGEPITEATPAVEVRGEIVFFCDGAHILTHERLLIDAEGSTGGPQRFTGILPAAPSPSLGQLRVLFIPMTFADQNEVPATEAKCYEIMKEVADFYAKSSFGRLACLTTVTPPIKLPHNEAWYFQKDNTDGVSKEIDGLGLEHNHARVEARKLGYDPFDYDTVILRLEGGPGGGVSRGGGSSVWLFGDSVSTCAHEIGHTFALAHANFWDTGGASAIGAGGSTEYGDIFDNMGSTAPPRGHYNVQAKNNVKWLPDGFVQTVTASGVYRIHAMDQTVLDPDRRYAVKIVKDNQRTYWGEVRALWDGNNNWVANGLILGWRWPNNSGNNLQLIDTTPGSAGQRNDSPIVLGQTFSDFEAGIHLTTVGVNTDVNGFRSLDVQVNLGTPATNLPPTLSLVASGLNVPAGASVTFTATAGDPNGDALAYQWLSSDNSTASTAIIGPNAPMFTRTFSTAGQFVVTCVASDGRGGSAVRYVLITVGNGNARFSISGRVTLDGQPLAGVYVSTGANNSVISDSDGYYTVPNLIAGTYTVAPLLYGYAFTELFNNSVLLGPNFTGADFAAEYAQQVSLAAATPNAFEAGVVPGKFTLTRTGSDADPLDVRLLPASGTAVAGDYALSPVPTSGTLYNYVTIPAGTNALDLLVTPVNDAAAEGPETVTLQLGLDAAYVLSGLATASVTIQDNDTVLPKISVTAPTVPATENPAQAAAFTVSRSGATTSNLTVNLAYSGSASNGLDYATLPASVVIAAGASATNLTLTPLDDAQSEDFETATLTIAAGAGYFADPASTNNSIVIVDDDTQVVSLEVGDAAALEVDLTVPGAVPNPGVFVVTRAGDTAQALTVNYSVSGHALHGVDYEPLPGSVTIPAGQPRASVVITPRFDGIGEGPETMFLQLAAGAGNYRLGLTNSGSVTITDAGDPPYVEVVPILNPQEPSGAGTFRFTLKGSVASNITVSYTMGGTAVAGVDYTALSSNLVIFGTGTNTVVNLTVTPLDNAVSNDLRTIVLNITPSPNYRTTDATASAMLWLFDNEVPAVFVDAHTTANHGLSTLTESGTTNKFYLSRTGSTASSLTVNFAFTGTAAQGSDFTAWAGVATIPAGVPGVDVIITNVNDGVFEGTETITLSLSPGAYARGPAATMYLYDDESSALRVGFPTNASVALESAGVVNLPVTLSAAAAGAVTVEYEVYTGSPTTGPTNFATQAAPIWLRLTRTNDEFRTLYSANGATWTPLGPARTNALDNPLLLGFAVTSASDGNLATATFDNVTLTPGPLGAFAGRDVGFVSATGDSGVSGGLHTVRGSGAQIGLAADEFHYLAREITGDFVFSARVTSSAGNSTNRLAGLMAREDARQFARHVSVLQRSTNTILSFSRTNSTMTAHGAGVDFRFTNGVLTFPAGTTNNSIPVALVDDTLVEPDEQIVLNLRHAYGALLGITNHVLDIADNDVAPLQPAAGFTTIAGSAAENGTPVVLIALSEPATNAVSVDYSVTGGTATAGVDFTLAAGTVNFAVGESVQALPLALLEDPDVESSETIFIGLSNAVGAVLTTLTNFTFTILDNDRPVISVTATDASAHESGDPGAWTFTRTGPDTTNLTVNFTRTGTATVVTDYATFPTNVTFLAGSNTVVVALTPLVDAVVDANETVILTVSPAGGHLVGSPASATVTITDANIPTVTITASNPNASETGPTAGQFTVARVGPTNAALTVNFTVTGTATNGGDFVSFGTSVVIPAGQSNAVVAVTPLEDGTTEGTEYVVTSLSASANYVIGAGNFASVAIADNDLPPTVFISSPNAKAVRLAPGNGLHLLGVADDDGAPNPLIYTWSKFSGPGAVTFSSTNTPASTAQFASNGLYILRITATDGQFTVKDDVTVEVGGFALPEWIDVNLGASSTRGKSGLSDGVFTVTGSGTNIAGTADSAHFVARQVNGTNTTFIARVTGLAGTTSNAVAGVMLRERNFRGARRVFVGMRTNGVVELRSRTADNGATTITAGGTVAFPRWFKLERSNDVVTAWQAVDVAGAPGAWAQVGGNVTLTGLRLDNDLGLAACNGLVNTLADATFDNVTLTPAPVGPALISEDMGTTTVVGSSTLISGTNTLQGGNSIGSDAGHYRFQQYVGDVTIQTRILSHTGTTDGSKGGVMLRDTSLDASPFGFMGMAYIRGGYFQRRNVPGGGVTTTIDNSVSFPYWLRIIRKGNSVTAWKAPNSGGAPGIWVQRGASQVFSAEAAIYAGLAVDNNGGGTALNTAKFDNFTITANNNAPTVNAGLDGFTFTGGTNLNGSVADDGNPNPPGVTTYSWSVVSGPGIVAFGDPYALNSSIGFSAPGMYVLRLTADDGEARVFDDATWNYVIPDAFTAWQFANFAGGPANPNAAAGADPEGDSLANLLEFAHGTDPNAANVAPMSVSITNFSGGQFLRLDIVKNAAASNILYSVQWTGALSNLTVWSGVGMLTNVNTPTNLVVRDTVPLDSLTNRTYRLEVTKP